MAKFVVIPIALSVKNNKIADHGDIVDESQLNSTVYDLLKDGAIRAATKEELEKAGYADVLEAELDTNLGKPEGPEDTIFNDRKSELLELGFVDVDSDIFKGISFPDSGVNFSDEDIKNASIEEFDALVLKAKELKDSKDVKVKEETDEAKKATEVVSKKDEVKNALTGKK